MKFKSGWLLTIGLLLLFALEILRVYFIMPFPGSQQSDTIGIAYFLDKNIIWLRILVLLIVLPPLWHFIRKGRPWLKILLTVIVLFYGLIFYMFNFRFLADKMFYQPGSVKFADAATNKIPLDKLVIGLTLNGEARAYPIQIIGYHHQIRDTFKDSHLMITYCTVCRTGRVYVPTVRGKREDFRLVGMDHFNAMFEDATTKSWWQQATGVAIAGPLKDHRLMELPSSQSTLGEWIAQYPDTKILQPDTIYNKQYEDLADYDKGTIKGSLEKRDSASWKMKSWVIGVATRNNTKAYDWNELISHPLIQDTVGSTPVLLLLGSDSATFYVWDRRMQGQVLNFEKLPGEPYVKDNNTSSTWSFNGKCIAGTLKGQQLQAMQSYQEFWHSWSQFHPGTTQYKYASNR